MNRLILNKLNIKKTCGTPVALVTELGSGKQTVIEETDNQFGDNLPSKIAIDARMFLLADINSKIDNFKIMIKEKIETAKKSIEVGSKSAKNFSHAASTLKTQKLTDLEKLKRELKTKKNDLELFKNKHQLERSASYPPSQIFIGGVLAMLLLVESVFNGFVFWFIINKPKVSLKAY